MTSKHILVVGGGIAGCTTALALAESGHRVTVVERNIIAAQTSGESSWAGAGIVFPLLPWMYRDEVNELALRGAALYPQLCRQLLAETGIDPELTPCGMLIKPPYDQGDAKAWCENNGLEYVQKGEDFLLPQVCQIRNPRLLQSLRQMLIQRGVTLLELTQLTSLNETELAEKGKITGWQTSTGAALQADAYVVTSGAWSFDLLKNTALQLNIKPMRGQILLYEMPLGTLPHIVYQDGFYLVQRRDGFLLAGSTLEDVGFDTGVTESARQEMQAKAEAILPALKGATIHKHWSGLRPGTPENLPTIARHPTIANLYLNTGHFRYGVTMAPESARRIVELITSDFH
jgi:glycine oxidase